MKANSFNAWLAEQIGRNDPVGDLARDAKDDLGVRNLKTLLGWQRYLRNAGACDGAQRALRGAWLEFEAHRG